MLQIFIDELNLSEIRGGKGVIDQKEKEKATEETAVILREISQKCHLLWIVISSSSVADRNAHTLNKEQLHEFIQQTNMDYVNLTKIMRNSQSIANVAPANKFYQFSSGYSGKETSTSIIPGECSTIIGKRPSAILITCSTDYQLESDPSTYKLYADAVSKYYKNIANQISQHMKVAIICDYGFEISKLLEHLEITEDIQIYDAGIKMFIMDGTTHYYYYYRNCEEDDKYGDTTVVQTWLNSGGVLLTHNFLFSGCEADVVIFVSQDWGAICASNDEFRSGVTRAVADLCVVTSNIGFDRDKLEKYFNVYNHSEYI